MADLLAFNNENFDINEWIEKAIIEKNDEENLESYLASIAMKLHLMSQDYTDQLETGMIESITTMPRILSEITRLEETLVSIDNEMVDLALQLKKLDQRNVTGIENLSRLDTLKSNMETCKATLEEHARWSQLVREAKSYLESGGRLIDSADRIEIMGKSLDVLRNISGHEERQETYQSLCESLLEIMRPKVREDISGSDMVSLKEYIYAYKKLGRNEELEEEYIKVRLDRVLNLWNSFNSTTSLFINWLRSYYDELLVIITNESNSIELLFSKERGPYILNSYINNIFTSITLSFYQRLIQMKSSSNVIECYIFTNTFTYQIIQLINSHSYTVLLSNNKINEILLCIYNSFISYTNHYLIDENTYISNEINENVSIVSFNMNDYVDPYDAINNFTEQLLISIDQSIEPLVNSINRCLTLFLGLKIKNLLKNIILLYNNYYLKQIYICIDCIKLSCGLSISTYYKDSSELLAYQNITIAEDIYKQIEVHELGTKPLLSNILKCIQCLGRLIKKVKEFDRLIYNNISTLSISYQKDINIDKLIQSNTLTSLTSNDINYIITNYILQQDYNLSSELKNFIHSIITSTNTSNTSNILSNIYQSIYRCKLSISSLLFDLTMNMPNKILSDYYSDDTWNKNTITLLKESMLPQSYLTQVGEYLLSLVQELEIFASSDALSDLIVILGELTNFVSLTIGWNQIKSFLQINEDGIIDNLSKRSQCHKLINEIEKLLFSNHNYLTNDSIESQQVIDATSDEETAISAVVNDILGAISDVVTGIFISQILKISEFSLYGKTQLIVDIDYISNVIQAMGLKTHPLLSHLYQLLLREPIAISNSLSNLTINNPGVSYIKQIDKKLSDAIIKGHK